MLMPSGTLNVAFVMLPAAVAYWMGSIDFGLGGGLGARAAAGLARAAYAGLVALAANAGLVALAANAGLVLAGVPPRRLAAAGLLRVFFTLRILLGAGTTSMDIGVGDGDVKSTTGDGAGRGAAAGVARRAAAAGVARRAAGVTRSTTARSSFFPMRPVSRTHLPVAGLHTFPGAHGGHAGMISPSILFFWGSASGPPKKLKT
jgi:hypothetical protein